MLDLNFFVVGLRPLTKLNIEALSHQDNIQYYKFVRNHQSRTNIEYNWSPNRSLCVYLRVIILVIVSKIVVCREDLSRAVLVYCLCVEVLDYLMGCDLGNRRERDDTNVTYDDVFRSVCSAYLRPILVVCADMTHSP
jgi:hypothetical protein